MSEDHDEAVNPDAVEEMAEEIDEEEESGDHVVEEEEAL